MSTLEAKRDWVYRGLAHPANVILASAARGQRLKPGNKLLLIGNEHAGGIGPFLGKLAVDAKVNCRFEWDRTATLESWLSGDRVGSLLKHHPNLIVVVLGTRSSDPSEISSRLADVLRVTRHVPVCWVLPLEGGSQRDALSLALPAADIPALHSEALEVHRSQTGAPSARGYAGWAGAVWAWIR
ncbi:MAG: hypothetical protein EBT03_11045 [Betaproteobacteria bacterium]|nr:hypothetical protein [Betaproteobacteria bacterium]NCA17330.1 hypothetical protein [Betaproteobacteria bacterium]